MSLVLQKPAADAAAKCGRVAVLIEGDSTAGEVSLNSGNAVYQALPDLVRRILEATLAGDDCNV
jgi:hypothetical protein